MAESDVADAAWLAELLEHGLLRGSFVPPAAIRELRDLTRYRKRLIQTHTAESSASSRMLEDAGSSWIRWPPTCLGLGPGDAGRPGRWGARPPGSGRAGQGAAAQQAPQLRQALRGRFRDHHALLVRLALGHLEQLESTIAALDRRVDEVMAPFARLPGHPPTPRRMTGDSPLLGSAVDPRWVPARAEL
jgi:transposase